MKALSHFRHLLQGQFFAPGLDSVYGAVVKRLASQVHHLEIGSEGMREAVFKKGLCVR